MPRIYAREPRIHKIPHRRQNAAHRLSNDFCYADEELAMRSHGHSSEEKERLDCMRRMPKQKTQSMLYQHCSRSYRALLINPRLAVRRHPSHMYSMLGL